MAKILFMIPDAARLVYAKEVLAGYDKTIDVVVARPSEGARIAREYQVRGVRVVAARAATAAAIRQAGMDVAVVEIPRTSFDIVRAIDDNDLKEKQIAFISYSEKIWGIALLNETFGVKIRQYTVSFKEDFEKEILATLADGAEVICGGFTVVKTAKRHNIPCVLIQVGKESLLQAAQEAKHICETLEIAAAKRDIFSTVLDYAYEGIVTVDQRQRITALNPFAQRLVNFDEAAIGQPVERVFPTLRLGKVVESGKEDLRRIVCVGNTKVMCNQVPIVVGGKSYGAVATFQDIGEIREMEAKIRQQMYARGHIAKFHFEDIIGKSDGIARAVKTAKKFAATKSSLLLLGETGTGKEVFAQSIHNGSPYAKGPFVALNCAALPANLLESELFGYVGGAFTGASKEGKPGLFEIAHGGTIFLDELAEMDYVNQGRLLRFLQEKVVVRLGSHKLLPIDARIIAATNQDLEQMVREHKFRDDLYYRLNVLSLELPSLRERESDIPLYAERFLKEFSIASGRDLRLTKEALRLLRAYAWPGNIREFRNIMERIAAVSETDAIGKEAILGVFRRNQKNALPRSSREARLLRELEEALRICGGNQSAAAKRLGISRTTLWRKIKKFQMEL